MKEYIDQIFYEGLGKSLYYPLEKKIQNIKNQKVSKSLIIITKSIYFIFSILLALLLLYFRL